MNFGQSFRLALKSLRTSKMRSLLTMLGIIIGVAAVIIITSLGNGMQKYMNDQFEELGSNVIEANVWRSGTSREIRTEDMYALVDKYPQYFSGVTPYSAVSATVRRGSQEFKRTSIYGVGETFYNPEKNTDMSGHSLGKGRFLSYVDVEREQAVCVIGSYLEKTAFHGDALGQTLTLSGAPYTVIGVLEKKGDDTAGSGDDVIYIPHTLADRMGTGGFALYMFTATDRSTSAAAKGIIEKRLYKAYQNTDNYMVITSAEMMDAMDSIIGVLMAVLTLIAAISLVVGGIGIMNIMLVSVTERTREIGIRKSLGAKGKDIRSQFIIEAGTTSAIGGVIGILLGILLANLITLVVSVAMAAEASGFTAVPTLSGIAVAFGVSVAIGVLFGFLPANKAARLNPIDALRYD